MTEETARNSLLDGRNIAPLTEQERVRAANVFAGLDFGVSARYEAGTTTKFISGISESGEEYGEIVFSADIYPGTNIINPNAALSLKGAAAHELAHYYRWQDKTELPHGELTHIDEAMTSLEAALRYSNGLNPSDLQGLISDSLHRLRLYVAEINKKNAE
jgi:hypothetical protein